MNIDLILWILAFVCFAIAAFGPGRWTRVDLVALGLALGSLTFIIS